MADWTWVESPGTALTEEPRLRTARFGDGYEQRAPDGINAHGQSWDFQADRVSEDEAAQMVAFLREHGTTGFDYVPLWETAAVRVICRKWRRAQSSNVGESSFSATFERVYEP